MPSSPRSAQNLQNQNNSNTKMKINTEPTGPMATGTGLNTASVSVSKSTVDTAISSTFQSTNYTQSQSQVSNYSTVVGGQSSNDNNKQKFDGIQKDYQVLNTRDPETVTTGTVTDSESNPVQSESQEPEPLTLNLKSTNYANEESISPKSGRHQRWVDVTLANGFRMSYKAEFNDDSPLSKQLGSGSGAAAVTGPSVPYQPNATAASPNNYSNRSPKARQLLRNSNSSSSQLCQQTVIGNGIGGQGILSQANVPAPADQGAVNIRVSDQIWIRGGKESKIIDKNSLKNDEKPSSSDGERPKELKVVEEIYDNNEIFDV